MSEELRKKFWCDIIISFIKSRKSEIGYSSETCEPYVEIADILLDEFDKRFEKVEDYDPLSCGLDGIFGRYISKGLSEIGIKTRRELFEFIRSRTEKKLPKDVF